MMNIEKITAWLGIIGTVVGIFISSMFARRAKKAEVHSQEIAIADQMIELVKKANAEALELNRKENEKLRKNVALLTKAIKAINGCKYNDDCPVTSQLRDAACDIEQQSADYNRQRNYPRSPPGYDSGGEV